MYFYAEIVNTLCAEFPEITEQYAEEFAWIKDTFQGRDTAGQTVYFDRCFCDFIGRLLTDERSDPAAIEKAFRFLENMAASEDAEVQNLLQVTVLEYLRSWEQLERQAEKLMLPETRRLYARVKNDL